MNLNIAVKWLFFKNSTDVVIVDANRIIAWFNAITNNNSLFSFGLYLTYANAN